MTDTFNGDNAALCESIAALLSMDAAGALGPHCVGGNARVLLESAESRLAALTQQAEERARNADVLMDALLWLRTWASMLATHVDGHFALPTDSSKAICIGHAEKVREMVARADAAIDATKKEEQPR